MILTIVLYTLVLYLCLLISAFFHSTSHSCFSLFTTLSHISNFYSFSLSLSFGHALFLLYFPFPQILFPFLTHCIFYCDVTLLYFCMLLPSNKLYCPFQYFICFKLLCLLQISIYPSLKVFVCSSSHFVLFLVSLIVNCHFVTQSLR